LSGLYLHIPFCKQACSYCDFYFVTRTSEREHFVQSLLDEIQGYQNTPYAEESVSTVYFGGGTPSLLEPKQVEQIMNALERTFTLDLEEITFEMNPDDVTREFLDAIKDIGINRASMGVQSFQPELLEFMHRAHSSEEALQCLELLHSSGFQTYTVDLIYGNPGQTLGQLKNDLDQLLEFDPPHVSAYSLTIESGTRLGKQVDLGRIAPPEDDNVAEHFDLINERLGEQGIRRYEVSNYSKPGKEAVHNSNYWRHHNYIGFGPGAHSFWWDEEAIRWEQEKDLRAYLRGKAERTEEKLMHEQLAEERLMLGLRTRWGVSEQELKERYRYELSEKQRTYLQECVEEDKLEWDDCIVLTDQGIKIADAIILDLVTLH